MFKTNRPSEERHARSYPATPKPHFSQSSRQQFRSIEEFSTWLDDELNLLEAMYADFTTPASLLGYFSR